MGPLMIAFLCAVGGSTWVYTKLQQRSGYGNTASVAKGTAVAGAVIFIVVYTIGLMVL
ncbi:MAG: hypothetical protein WBP03_02295 [Candidatus Saccharimonadales bacterium]|jgi:hypothetical protein